MKVFCQMKLMIKLAPLILQKVQFQNIFLHKKIIKHKLSQRLQQKEQFFLILQRESVKYLKPQQLTKKIHLSVFDQDSTLMSVKSNFIYIIHQKQQQIKIQQFNLIELTMSMKTSPYVSNSLSSLPKLQNLDSNFNYKNLIESKKFFTRKQNKNQQNTSRFASNRLKTQQPQNVDIQPSKMTKNQRFGSKKQLECFTFLTNKSSKSLEKLVLNSSSMHNLPILSKLNYQQKVSQMTPKIRIGSNLNEGKQLFLKNGSNSTSTSLNQVLREKSSISNDFNDEMEMILTKEMVGSTQISSNENICSSQFMDSEYFQNPNIKTMTLSGWSSNKNKNNHKQCAFCSIKQKSIIQLQKKNAEILSYIQEKQSEIKILIKKIYIIQKSLKNTKNQKINLQSEIKIVKQNSQIIESQKEQIQKFNHKLQSNVKKMTQDLKYKELEINISKIYKTKSLELQFKVETLRKELQREKLMRKRIETSQSSQNLQKFFMKRDFSNISLKTPGSDISIKQKKPIIKKVYQEDSLFSLSSQSSD